MRAWDRGCWSGLWGPPCPTPYLISWQCLFSSLLMSWEGDVSRARQACGEEGVHQGSVCRAELTEGHGQSGIPVPLCVGRAFPHCTELGQPLPMQAVPSSLSLLCGDKGALPQLPAASPFVPLQLSMLCMDLSPRLQRAGSSSLLEGCSAVKQPGTHQFHISAAQESVACECLRWCGSEQPLPSSPHPTEVLWGHTWANNLRRKRKAKGKNNSLMHSCSLEYENELNSKCGGFICMMHFA